VPPPLPDPDDPELEPAPEQAPFEQLRPDPVQSMQVPPPVPHAVFPVPAWQLPELSQQPLQLVGAHTPPPEPEPELAPELDAGPSSVASTMADASSLLPPLEFVEESSPLPPA
jgi:hypothetical protein